MVSYQKSPTCHAYAWQIGPFWQDTLDFMGCTWVVKPRAVVCKLTIQELDWCHNITHTVAALTIDNITWTHLAKYFSHIIQIRCNGKWTIHHDNNNNSNNNDDDDNNDNNNNNNNNNNSNNNKSWLLAKIMCKIGFCIVFHYQCINKIISK